MSGILTQEQLDVLAQSIRRKNIKIEILNKQFKIIDTIEGEAIDGSIDLDANSDYRRSCNLTLVVSDLYSDIVKEKYVVGINSLVWLDKYVKIYVGIYDEQIQDNIWFNCGLYVIDTPSYSYSLIDNILKFNGMDLMYELSENRYGQLTDYGTKILATNNDKRTTMREAFINILQTYTNITQYYIASLTGDLEYLPEDITFSAGETIYGMLSKLLNYLPGWEMFFDEDGVFTLQPIPQGQNDAIIPLDLNYTLLEEVSVDFNSVKNLVVIRGRTHDCDYFVENTEINISQEGDDLFLILNMGNVIEYDIDTSSFLINNNATFGFVWYDNQYNPANSSATSQSFNKIRITDGTHYQDFNLYDFEGETTYIPLGKFQPGSINVVRCVNINNTLYFDYLSNGQANAFAVDDNLLSPYYINAELKDENYYGGLTYCANHVNYNITLNNVNVLSEINDGVKITLMPNVYNNANPVLTIKDGVSGNILLNNIPIVYKNDTSIGLLDNEWFGDNTIYLLIYNKTNNQFILQGRHQTYTYYLSGGEYENIYSNSLAQQRADYELYLHSNLNNNVVISTIPNYYMDVNKKISYKAYIDETTSYYLTKKISLPLKADGSAMSIEAIELYE